MSQYSKDSVAPINKPQIHNHISIYDFVLVAFAKEKARHPLALLTIYSCFSSIFCFFSSDLQ